MTTYTTITNAEIDQDSPITQPLLTALRDNPIALAEGAAGAPKVQAAALNTFVGSGPGTITGLDNYVAINFRGGGSSSDGGIQATIEFSDDNGSTWSAAETFLIASIPGGDAGSCNFDTAINLETGAYSTQGGVGGANNPHSKTGTITLPTGRVNAVRVVNISGSANIAFNVYGG